MDLDLAYAKTQKKLENAYPTKLKKSENASMIKGQLLENASENSKSLWQNVLEIKDWLWLRLRNVWLVLEDVKKLKARKKELSQHVEVKINKTIFKSRIIAATKETVERSHGETLYVLKPK